MNKKYLVYAPCIILIFSCLIMYSMNVNDELFDQWNEAIQQGRLESYKHIKGLEDLIQEAKNNDVLNEILNYASKGRTLLHNAVTREFEFTPQEPAIKLLLQQPGLDINKKDKKGWTPLQSAIANKKQNMAKLLIEYGAMVDESVVDDDGDTILHIAASNNMIPIIKLLLKKGYNTEIKNKSGKYWIDLLDKEQKGQMKQFLSNLQKQSTLNFAQALYDIAH